MLAWNSGWILVLQPLNKHVSGVEKLKNLAAPAIDVDTALNALASGCRNC